ncbi:MAG: class I SAM-dependent methyltransferase, partial [Promethearchaeota archaeon]
MTDSKPMWSLIQSAEEIDIGRYFEYDNDAIEMLSRWLYFLKTPSTKVLEVGAGNGFFTSILLRINPKMELACLEPDAKFSAILKKRLGSKANVIQRPIEDSGISFNSYDAAITHIVIHNVPNPLEALSHMKNAVRSGGFVITIEPLPIGRHYLPSRELEQAFALLHEATLFLCRQRQLSLKIGNSVDPWRYNYPFLFEEVGLTFLQCHGWTSIFTLSDERYEFDELKKWIKMRHVFVTRSRKET